MSITKYAPPTTLFVIPTVQGFGCHFCGSTVWRPFHEAGVVALDCAGKGALGTEPCGITIAPSDVQLQRLITDPTFGAAARRLLDCRNAVREALR